MFLAANDVKREFRTLYFGLMTFRDSDEIFIDLSISNISIWSFKKGKKTSMNDEKREGGRGKKETEKNRKRRIEREEL